jgi:hypothetical protein
MLKVSKKDSLYPRESDTLTYMQTGDVKEIRWKWAGTKVQIITDSDMDDEQQIVLRDKANTAAPNSPTDPAAK